MRLFAVVTLRPLRALLAGALLFGAGVARAADESNPVTPIQLTFERPLDAVGAPFVLAASKGFYRAESVAVANNFVNGSQEALARVASGVSDIALVDINALIRYRDKADAAPIKAVYMLLNAAPYAIVARKSRGIGALADMAGKTLGVADGDLSIRLWPAVAKRNGITLASVRLDRIGAAVREPMLSAGQVDAVAGFSYLSAVNLRDRGIPAGDLAVLRFADYGSVAYGLALVVNPKFAATKPQAVRGFLRAVTAGLQFAIRHPAQAVEDVLPQLDGGARDLELARLKTALHDNIVTPDVKRDGLGGIDPARFAASVGEIAEDFKFQKPPAVDDIFDASFLPDASLRKVE
ncbi:MAG: hypothetical protein JWP21_1983 [Tardiphaga sp.]|nr:hypothetical protein [Tardiphaga sp.]